MVFAARVYSTDIDIIPLSLSLSLSLCSAHYLKKKKSTLLLWLSIVTSTTLGKIQVCILLFTVLNVIITLTNYYQNNNCTVIHLLIKTKKYIILRHHLTRTRQRRGGGSARSALAKSNCLLSFYFCSHLPIHSILRFSYRLSRLFSLINHFRRVDSVDTRRHCTRMCVIE